MFSDRAETRRIKREGRVLRSEMIRTGILSEQIEFVYIVRHFEQNTELPSFQCNPTNVNCENKIVL